MQVSLTWWRKLIGYHQLSLYRKKNDKLRICIDFRRLNATTKKKPYPLFFTEEVLDKVAGHKVYLFLDGFFGYHQIMIAPKDTHKVAFIIDWGTFIWVVMPFRLNNAPQTYQWAVCMTLKGLSWNVHETILG